VLTVGSFSGILERVRAGDRREVEWVRPWSPTAVGSVMAGLVLAAFGLWVPTGHLPGPVAEVLFVLALVLMLWERAALRDPAACPDAAVVVGAFAWCVALGCGLVVSAQRSVWVDGTPVAWWVHVLVACGIIGVVGAVTWTVTVPCFLVSEDAALLGAAWGVLAGVVATFSLLWMDAASIWLGLVVGAVTALGVGLVCTALLRVKLVPPEAGMA
jgi:hypothetical protein